jgi:hypothetical protein
MKRAKSAKNNLVGTDDVKNIGGKEMILNRLVNHYKAISNVKPKIDIKTPHPHVDSGKVKSILNIYFIINIILEKYNKEEFYNIHQTYKGVASIKPVVDSNKPFTYYMGKNMTNYRAKEKFDDFEHIRRLNAMSKRILSIGKPHERRKNQNDPISNPTYFFRKPGDEKAIQLVSLNKFNERLKEMVNLFYNNNIF